MTSAMFDVKIALSVNDGGRKRAAALLPHPDRVP